MVSTNLISCTDLRYLITLLFYKIFFFARFCLMERHFQVIGKLIRNIYFHYQNLLTIFIK